MSLAFAICLVIITSARRVAGAAPLPPRRRPFSSLPCALQVLPLSARRARTAVLEMTWCREAMPPAPSRTTGAGQELAGRPGPAVPPGLGIWVRVRGRSNGSDGCLRGR